MITSTEEQRRNVKITTHEVSVQIVRFFNFICNTTNYDMDRNLDHLAKINVIITELLI